MFSYLKGKFIETLGNKIIIDVAGVGYGVYLSLSSLEKIVKEKEIELFIHTHVREDALDLYGFLKKGELELFELLLNVSGIGPKSALAIVDRDPEQIKAAISKADVGFFTTIPRIGKKNAQRIIVDLKSKLKSIKELELGKDDSETQELMEVLKSLGFTQKEILAIVPKIPKETKTLEEKINFSLKFLGSK